MQIVRQSEFKASPWKNGGGITHEALRVPEQGADFRWRVSVAHIDAGGPFSNFTGYGRTMVLLRGGGVVLRLSDGSCRMLRAAGDMAQFDGALGVECELLSGPCVDLNLMASKSMGAVHARVERLQDPRSVRVLDGQSMVVFPIDGAVEVQTSEASGMLEPWDLAVLEGPQAGSAQIAACAGASGFVFLATLESAPSVLVRREQ